MKAAFFNHTGGPEVLQYGEVPDPVAGPGQVVVDIHAASVNGVDWKIRKGGYVPVESFPCILGRDFSGVVSEIGEGVVDLAVGDPVFGVSETRDNGAYAERIAINAAIVARKPESITHVEMASIALTGLTALVAIEETLDLQPGETVLVHGGAGGVGGLAVQLAKHRGARVITTASAANAEYVRRLGADEVIDYTAGDFTRLVSGCDAVLDTVGGDVAQRSFAVVRPGGRAAFIASGPSAPESSRTDVVSLRPQVDRSRARLERLLELLRVGALHLPEITVFRLWEAAAAHELSQGRHLRGKLVFRIRD